MLGEFSSWLKAAGGLAKAVGLAKAREVATQGNGAGKNVPSQESPEQKLLQCTEG